MDTNQWITAIFIVALAWFVYKRMAPVKGLNNVNAAAFQKQLSSSTDKLLLDVREKNEYKSGYIPGAVNIPLSQIRSWSAEVPKDRQIFLYCRSGMRSRQAAAVLKKNGFANITNLQSGILSWEGPLSK
ncbi:rhodanese-like domain-containing protein [Paenibacillus mendelii]|uniref:Rhodanese-like domain-containing protein n=1 Tax=Paenibacillus mendelii TaxID=206163 RepID=A0ABV6JG76_9BACL|nr:rhodanese-like domain-containing protein [Paenibacillus mendelii]MCQ6557761.1 rhodanese-like domain-containing protein [Paenibacillus mendelii]